MGFKAKQIPLDSDFLCERRFSTSASERHTRDTTVLIARTNRFISSPINPERHSNHQVLEIIVSEDHSSSKERQNPLSIYFQSRVLARFLKGSIDSDGGLRIQDKQTKSTDFFSLSLFDIHILHSLNPFLLFQKNIVSLDTHYSRSSSIFDICHSLNPPVPNAIIRIQQCETRVEIRLSQGRQAGGTSQILTQAYLRTSFSLWFPSLCSHAAQTTNTYLLRDAVETTDYVASIPSDFLVCASFMAGGDGRWTRRATTK